jgi:rod shape-determining protein MreB
MSGLPKTVILSALEVRGAIAEPVNTMVDSVLSCVSESPPELAQDLIERGIHLVGGGSLLKGLDLRLSKETEVPVRLVRQPLESVVLGAGRVIESYEELRDMFMGVRR